MLMLIHSIKGITKNTFELYLGKTHFRLKEFYSLSIFIL